MSSKLELEFFENQHKFLDEWPIGTKFNYLNRLMFIRQHLVKNIEDGYWKIGLVVDYADKNGVIRTMFISEEDIRTVMEEK